MTNSKPEAKGNSKAVEDEVNRIMAKHEKSQGQPVSDADHREIMDRLREQYGSS